jgi:hypothetical protein
MTTTVALCVDCDTVPLPKDGSRNRCRPCQTKFLALERQELAEADARKTKRKWSDPLNLCRYSRFYLWKGKLVGLTSGVNDKAMVYCEHGMFLVAIEPSEKVLARVASDMIDFNQYQPQFPKSFVKQFKAMLLASTGREGERLNWCGCE